MPLIGNPTDDAGSCWGLVDEEPCSLFRAMFEQSAMGMAVTDPTGVLRDANPVFAAMLGYRPEELRGVPLNRLTPVEDWNERALAMVRLIRGEDEAKPFERRFLHRDGRVVLAIVRPSLVRDGGGRVTAVTALVEDITERRAAEGALKRSEEALALSEAHNRAIVETAIEAILTVDTRGTIIGANPAAERMFGFTHDELIGKHIHILMSEDEAARHASYMHRYLTTGERHIIGKGREVAARRSDGSTFPAWLSLTEIDQPGFHAFVGMIRDITDMKRAELALIEAKEAAELANRAKTAFLSNMSHELRTPLNGILGFAEVIQQQMLGASENPGYLHYVAEIKRSGELLLANVNDLLEMATIEAGAVDLDETLFDFRDVVVSCLRLIGKRAERAKLHVQANIEMELPPLLADPRALKQVLLHLLSNAIKFTPEGGTIGVSARVDSNGGLVATVFDTGIGIPADRLETVFQPFVQGEAAMSRRYEGIGLGLSIAKSLVEQHGGKLEIRSLEDSGTSVLIHLPKDRFVADW
ncbi:MAG TPA: PAS domain S-box protein [Azospirillum sp.]|nr:PAS domain S-box protein [Azospirillum sp.]